MSNAYVLMAQTGESWQPVAVYLTEKRAQEVADILNTRLFGPQQHCDHGYGEGSRFTILTLDMAPRITNTGIQQYHLVDPDDPDWHPPISCDYTCDGAPDDMYATALMLEHGTMEFQGFELREPEVTK